MINDFMSDPHTKKPKVETMMEVRIQKIPINLSFDELAMNSTISKEC